MERLYPALRVYLLGRFVLECERPEGGRSPVDSFESDLRGPSAILFKLLLCNPERRIPRDLLVGAIWPGHSSSSIGGSLDVAKSVLKRKLEDLCGYTLLPRVRGNPPMYSLLGQELLWTDLDHVEHAIRRALLAGDDISALSLWEEAYALMQRGDLLLADRSAYWYPSSLVQDRRSRLAKQRTQCVLRIADLLLARGATDRALSVLTAEVGADPSNEAVAFHLISQLMQLDRSAEALAYYARLEFALLECNAEPAEETKRLALKLRASQAPGRLLSSSSFERDQTGHLPAASVAVQERAPASSVPISSVPHILDWGDAPQAKLLYGREQDEATLSNWIVHDHAHMVAIIGMAGVGKTSLSVALVEQIQTAFSVVIWRSLQNAPPLATLLQSCIQEISDQQRADVPDDLDDLLSLFLSYLRMRRCLLVLDNVESILQGGTRVGEYRSGYEGYGRLLMRIGEAKHQSCLLITSREKPRELALLEDSRSLIRSYPLKGLLSSDGMQILKDKDVQGTRADQETLIALYTGNPLALKLVSQYIIEVFHGDLAAFLRDGAVIFSDIQDVLDQQFERLSPLEQTILYWLAIEREPVEPPLLQEDLVRPASRKELQEALRSLRRRHLVEATTCGFVLQNVVMEYVTNRLIELVCEEMGTGSLVLFGCYALIKAQSKEYVRESQVHRILQPVAQWLLTTQGKVRGEHTLRHLLSQLRAQCADQPGYAAGNILNLLLHLGFDIRGYDFSHLVVRQAYAQGAVLHEVNFSFASLASSVFTDTFGSVLSVAMSPDGSLLAAGTANGEVRIWHMPSGNLVQTCRGHTDWIRSVAFHPNGSILASGSEDQTVRLWNIPSGQCEKTLWGHTSWIRSVAFSPDGRRLATGSDDHTIRLWDVGSGQELATLEGHEQRVWSVTWSPDGKLLASGSEDQTVRLWDVQNRCALTTLRGQLNPVYTVIWSPDGKLLASGSEDQTVCIWDVVSSRLLSTFRGHTKQIRSVAFSPDGQLLASSGDDHTIRLWDVGSGQCKKTLCGHTNLIWSVTFHPNGQALASGSHDQTVRIWEVSSGQCLKTLQGHTSWVRSVAFSPDGSTLVSDSDDQTMRQWETATGQQRRMFRGHTNLIWSMAFSPDGCTLVSGSEDQTVRLWDVQNGSLLKTLQGHTSWVRSVAFSPDGCLVASGSEDHTVRLWNVRTGQCERTLQEHASWVRSVAFHPDGRLLASGSDDRTVRLWDVRTGTCLRSLQAHESMVWSVAFSPDGTTLASGSHDQTVRLWNVRTGRLLTTLRDHTDWVWSVAFSPDGTTLASGSHDQTVRLWDVEMGRCIKVLSGHTSWVWSVAFSPDGQTLASGSDDGTIKLWDLRTGTCRMTLRSERPYELMDITGAQGITEMQKATLKALGAIEHEEGA